jgi:hypothetical protein
MPDRIELFERRNRLRIVALVVLATFNYIVAVVMAAIALGIGLAVVIIFQGGDIRSWDVALSSWAIALTSSAISAVDDPDDDNFLKAILGSCHDGWRNRPGLGVTRPGRRARPGRGAVHPQPVLADPCPREARRRVEPDPPREPVDRPALARVPSAGPRAHAVAGRAQRLARELLLDERIDNLRELAGEAPRPVTQ